MATDHDNAKLFLTGPQYALMVAVLDRIIPRDGELPGAGELRVADYMDTAIASSQGLRRLFAEGLASLEAASQEMHSKEFVGLSEQQASELLRRLESERGEFFEAMVRQTYADYYSNPTIVRLLGLEQRPPQPGGYQLEPFDPGLLEQVKKRSRLYKDV